MTVPLSTEQVLHKMLIEGQLIYHDYSGVKLAQIGAGSYSPSYPIDLGSIYDTIRIFCEDATYVPSGTYMGAYVCVSYPAYCMMLLMEHDDPGTPWSHDTPLPTSGSFDFWLTHATGTRWILPTLTEPSDGELELFTYGIHKSQ